MDLKNAIYSRRSIKKFKSKPVDASIVKRILEYGVQAPTACNVQGWRYIIVDNHNIKRWLVDSGSPLFVQTSPVGILVLYDNRTGNLEYKDYIQSAAASIQNMLLAAQSFGVGACWVCRLPSQSTLRKFFKIPKIYDVIGYVALGYQDYTPKTVPRKYKMHEIVSTNIFEGKVSKSSIKRRIYLLVPRPLKLFYRFAVEGRFIRKLKKK